MDTVFGMNQIRARHTRTLLNAPGGGESVVIDLKLQASTNACDEARFEYFCLDVFSL